MEASEFGYVVEAVDGKPGQDPALCAGMVIIAIGGAALLGFEEEALEEAFGAQFRDGAELLLLAAEELRRAVAQRAEHVDATADVVLEHGSVVHVHVASIEAFRGLAASVRKELSQDLATFGLSAGIRAELYSPEGVASATVVLSGIPEEVGAARPELGRLLRHYGLGPGRDAASADEGAETLEVEGMVMQSLPARNRRRRKAPEGCEADRGDKVRATEVAPADGAEEGEVAIEGDGTGQEALGPGSEEVRQFEYMDHTADVILHSWGRTAREAWEQVCVCFFSYMTDLDSVAMTTSVEVEATGHDILDLLYHLLDEFLFSFGTEFIMCRRVEILEMDEVGLKVRARGFGERFDLSKHPQGTEIKAITMHQMKLLTPETLTSEDGTIPRKQSGMEGGNVRVGFPYECYVLVDI